MMFSYPTAILVVPADVPNPVQHIEALLNQIALPPLMQHEVGFLRFLARHTGSLPPY